MKPPFAKPEHFPLTAKIVYEMLSETTGEGAECLFGYRSRLDLAMVMVNKDALGQRCKDYYAGTGKSMEEWYPGARVRGWIDDLTAEKLMEVVGADDPLSESSVRRNKQ